MTNQFERTASTTAAVAAALLVVVNGTSTLGVVAAAALVVSTIIERRSLAWVLLVSALLLIGPAAAVIAAAALASPGNERDLTYQGDSALRRCVAAAINPALTVGAAFGAYRFGGRVSLLWWFIGWLPAALVAAMSLVFLHDPVWSQMLLVTIGAGVFLSLESGQTSAAEAQAEARPAAGRTVLARRAGGALDWTDVIPELVPYQGRPAKPPVAIPNDARELEVLSDDDGNSSYIQG